MRQLSPLLPDEVRSQPLQAVLAGSATWRPCSLLRAEVAQDVHRGPHHAHLPGKRERRKDRWRAVRGSPSAPPHPLLLLPLLPYSRHSGSFILRDAFLVFEGGCSLQGHSTQGGEGRRTLPQRTLPGLPSGTIWCSGSEKRVGGKGGCMRTMSKRGKGIRREGLGSIVARR